MRSVVAVAASVLLLTNGCASGGGERGEPSATQQSAPDPAPTGSPTERSGLHLDCTGEGDPAVVLVAGLGTAGDTFAELQDSLAAEAHVCSYDRAGIGDSPPLAEDAPDPSPGTAAADLRETLAAAGIEPPYVLLGWSYGGLVTQAYAKAYPDDVAGLVLEDTSVREQFTDGPLVDPGIDWAEGGRDIDTAAVLDDVADPDFGDVPVAVLSQDTRAPWIRAFYRSHDRLARASSDGIHAIGTGSGHAMHEDVPPVVLAAVRAVWAAAAGGTPLGDCREALGSVAVRCRV